MTNMSEGKKTYGLTREVQVTYLMFGSGQRQATVSVSKAVHPELATRAYRSYRSSFWSNPRFHPLSILIGALSPLRLDA